MASSRDAKARFEAETPSSGVIKQNISNSTVAEPDVIPTTDPVSTDDRLASPAAGNAMSTATNPALAAANPLAAPPMSRGVVNSPAAQVAELHLPRIGDVPHVTSNTLRGNHDSLVRQNERSEEEALERIEDDADLQDRITRGMLVRVPESQALSVNTALPEDRRYCRPWTADFLTDISRAHQLQFHRPLVVSSAVRTVEYQKRLMRTNHNAAGAEGEIVSPHLTGATIDIAKSGLARSEMQWMRGELLAYQNAGLIDVEEEFRQRCFHITVYKDYTSAMRPHEPVSPVSDAASKSE